MYDVSAMSNGVLSSAVRKAKNAGTPVFTNDNFNNGVLEVNDCEQLVYAFIKSMRGFNSQNDITKIVLNPKEDGIAVNGFYFQNYEGLKEGLNSGFNFSSNSQDGTHSITIEPLTLDTTTIIQGVQTQGFFIRCYEYSTGTYSMAAKKATFNNIYFKDCVCTKTSGTPVFDVGQGDVSYGQNAYAMMEFNNCKLSMHIRQGENSPVFDKYTNNNYKITWTKCARYIEFSDLNPSNIPSYNPMFAGQTTECSTIVRNASFYTASNSNDNVLFQNSVNSSWDLEAYACGTSSWIPIGSINNCFLRIDCTEERLSTRIIFNSTSGVNILTTSSFGVESNANVKQLSDSDCRNPQILNKWGFFVNTIDDEE